MEDKKRIETTKDFAEYVLESLGNITVGELMEMRDDHIAKLSGVVKMAKEIIAED